MVSEKENKQLELLMIRVKKLELWTHPPVNWERKIKSLEDAYVRLYNRVKNYLKGEQMDWFINNWDVCLASFFLLEKIVKLSPTKYDDILLDVVWNAIRKALKK